MGADVTPIGPQPLYSAPKLSCEDEGMAGSSIPITEKALREFKAIYRRKFGEELTDDQATEMAGRVLRLFEVLTRIRARTSQVRTASRLTDRGSGP